MLIDAQGLDAERAYRLLVGAVVPRPVAWITSQRPGGPVNLAPFSAFTYVSNDPPMLGIHVARRGDGRKDTSLNVHASGEFVVHIAGIDQVRLVHDSSFAYPPEVGEAQALGLALSPSARVAVPRLRDAPVAMECRLERVVEFGRDASELVVGEVLVFHVRDDLIANGKIDSRALAPLARLGGPLYASLGEIVRMSLPVDVRSVEARPVDARSADASAPRTA